MHKCVGLVKSLMLMGSTEAAQMLLQHQNEPRGVMSGPPRDKPWNRVASEAEKLWFSSSFHIYSLLFIDVTVAG